MINIRHITRADIIAFNREGTGRTVRGYAVDRDGELAAIAGVAMGQSGWEMFADIREGQPKYAVWKCAVRIMAEVRRQRLPVIAIASEEIPGSKRFLERLGFKYISDSSDGKVYSL